MTYIKEIIFSAIVCGFLSELSPGKERKSGKIFKYIVSIVFLLILLSPLINIIKDLPKNLTENELNYNENSHVGETIGNIKEEYTKSFEVISAEICKTTAKMAADNFKVSENDFNLKLLVDVSDENKYQIKEIAVYPTGNAAKIKKEDLVKYFKSILHCEVKIVLQ